MALIGLLLCVLARTGTFRCNEHAGLLLSIAHQVPATRRLAASQQRSQISAMTDQTTTTDNPLLESWTGPFGVPPFSRIGPEHFMPAFDRAFAEHDAEIAAITGDAAVPTFSNTVEAMERSGRTLDRVSRVFGVLAGAHTNDALLAVEREIAAREG